MEKLFSLMLESPLANDFVQSYHTWFQRHAISVHEGAVMYEVVIDGHEKVSSKCVDAHVPHGGRPRKGR